MKLPKNIVKNIVEYNHEYSTSPFLCDEITIVYKPWISEKVQTFRFPRTHTTISLACVNVLEQLQDAVLNKHGKSNIIKFKICKERAWT